MKMKTFELKKGEYIIAGAEDLISDHWAWDNYLLSTSNLENIESTNIFGKEIKGINFEREVGELQQFPKAEMISKNSTFELEIKELKLGEWCNILFIKSEDYLNISHKIIPNLSRINIIEFKRDQNVYIDKKDPYRTKYMHEVRTNISSEDMKIIINHEIHL